MITNTGQIPASVLTNSAAVDLCRQPYLCKPEQDITERLQAAINAQVPLWGGTIRCSKRGEYRLEQPMQEGEVNGHPYKGQILFPYVKTTEPRIPIQIEGCAPVTMEGWGAAAEPVSPLGVSFVSNLANVLGNNIFTTMAGSAPVSNVEPRFLNIQLGCSAVHPELTICQFENALSADLRGVRASVWKAASEITVGGAGYGIRLPKVTNAGWAYFDGEVDGFGNGISHSEHAIIGGGIRRAKVALRPSGGSANIAEYRKIHVHNCTTVIEPEGSGCVLLGSISIEDEVAEQIIKDKTNLLTGVLTVRQDKAGGTNTKLTMEGAKNLVIRSLAWTPGVYTAALSIEVPATTVAVRNTIFRDINAYIAAGASTCKVFMNEVEVMTIPANETRVVPWDSGAEIKLEYASAPGWKLSVR
jgi:hypothetical protein